MKKILQFKITAIMVTVSVQMIIRPDMATSKQPNQKQSTNNKGQTA
jgi:hypothetical protein